MDELGDAREPVDVPFEEREVVCCEAVEDRAGVGLAALFCPYPAEQRPPCCARWRVAGVVLDPGGVGLAEPVLGEHQRPGLDPPEQLGVGVAGLATLLAGAGGE